MFASPPLPTTLPMSHADDGPSTPLSRPLGSPAGAVAVLRHFAADDGPRFDEAGVEQRVNEARDGLGPEAPRSARLDALARVGQALGLHTSLMRLDAAQAYEVLLAGQDLAVPATGSDSWWLLGREGGAVLARELGQSPDRGRPLGSAQELADLLDADPAEPMPWLAAEAPSLHEESVDLDALDVDHGHGAAPTPLQRLRAVLRPDRGDVVAVVIFAITAGVLNLATPIAVQAIVNSVALGGVLQQLVVVVGLLALALAFAASLVAIQQWIVELIQRRIFVRTLAHVAARLPRVGAGAYDAGYGPELVNRIFDVVTIQKSVSKLLIDGLGLVLSVVVGLAVLAFYHPLLLAFDVVLLGAIAVLVLAPLRRGEKSAIQESNAKYGVAAWLEEIARSPQAFKVGGAEQWVFERTDAVARQWLESRRGHFRVLFGQISGALVLLVLSSTALLGIGGLLVIRGSLTLGQLVAAELIVTTVVASVAKMGKHMESWYDLMAASKKVGQLLDVEVEPSGGEVLAPGAGQGPASLEIRDLSWVDERGRARFEGVDLEVAPGARVALTGPSGSGKSALLDMLWRLRTPSSGVIRLDGRDVRDLSLESLRREVALVSRVEVVTGTVRENVQLHRPSVSADDVRRALRAVGLDESVDQLPDGLDTIIHPSTRLLTEGEMRRLMLARAIAGRPRLLVVDDQFAGPRGDVGDRVRESLFAPDAGWTLLVVSSSNEVQELCNDCLALGAEPAAAGEVSR